MSKSNFEGPLKPGRGHGQYPPRPQLPKPPPQPPSMPIPPPVPVLSPRLPRRPTQEALEDLEKTKAESSWGEDEGLEPQVEEKE